MTTEDYKILANVIRVNNNKIKNKGDKDVDNDLNVLRDLTDDFCVELKRNNPRFNKEKFLEACGVQ